MSKIEELQRNCAYCRQPITLKWKNGLTPSEGVRLVVDQVFHDECWDKFFAVYHGKQRKSPTFVYDRSGEDALRAWPEGSPGVSPPPSP
jgi:hypothetical protein